MDTAQGVDAGLTTFEWLTVIGVVMGVLLTAIGVMAARFYNGVIRYIGEVKDDLKKHVDKDDAYHLEVARFMGRIDAHIGSEEE